MRTPDPQDVKPINERKAAMMDVSAVDPSELLPANGHYTP
jgi:hypothetical protein